MAATVMLACLAAPLWVAFRRRPADAAVALAMTGTAMVGILLALCTGFARPAYYYLAEVLALLSSVGILAFARFLERWV